MLAIAVARGYLVASDESAVRKAARDELGQQRVAGSLDLLKWAVQENRLKVGEAVRILPELDRGPAVMAMLQRRGEDVAKLLT